MSGTFLCEVIAMIARENSNEWAGSFWIAVALGMVVLIGSLDYLTGNEIGLAFFYLFPIVLVTWCVKRWDGFWVSVVSVVVWLSVESMSDRSYSDPNSIYWNTAVRLGFFVLVVAIVSSLKMAFQENSKLILRIQIALARINTSRARTPICLWCQRVRDEQGYWRSLEVYMKEHSGLDAAHGVCPECLDRLEKDAR